MAYVNKYHFDAEGICALAQASREMEEALKAAFDESKALFDLMQGTDLWIGQRKEEFAAYFHLVIQYHGWLLGIPVASAKAGASVQPELNCCEEMNKAWTQLKDNMAKFTANSDAYKKLEEIS